MRTITCEDCGCPYDTPRSNTKVCMLCRLVRNAKFLKKTTTKCWVCEAKFAPLERNEILCGQCDSAKRQHDAEGTCVACQQEVTNLLHKDITICRPCSTKPAGRKPLVGALVKKQAERMNAVEQIWAEHNRDKEETRTRELAAFPPI